jgi:hypothetical protein
VKNEGEGMIKTKYNHQCLEFTKPFKLKFKQLYFFVGVLRIWILEEGDKILFSIIYCIFFFLRVGHQCLSSLVGRKYQISVVGLIGDALTDGWVDWAPGYLLLELGMGKQRLNPKDKEKKRREKKKAKKE